MSSFMNPSYYQQHWDLLITRPNTFFFCFVNNIVIKNHKANNELDCVVGNKAATFELIEVKPWRARRLWPRLRSIGAPKIPCICLILLAFSFLVAQTNSNIRFLSYP